MKISDIVKVKLDLERNENVVQAQELNEVAAAIVIMPIVNEVDDVTDTVWRKATDIVDIPYADTNQKGQIEKLKRLKDTFFNNGGQSLIVKRVFINSEVSAKDAIVNAVYGTEEEEALDVSVINIMFVDYRDGGTDYIWSKISVIAKALKGTSALDTKLLLFNKLKSELIDGDDINSEYKTLDNVLVNVYDRKAGENVNAMRNNYEVALVAAYVSNIDYYSQEIKGLEYTVFNGYSDELNNLNIVGRLSKLQSNHLTGVVHMINRKLLLGANLLDGSNYLAKYFTIVISQKITNDLARLLVNKLRFETTTYSTISNSLTTLMDVFTRTRLLDTGFVADTDKIVTINEPGGERTYKNIRLGETLAEGYKVVTLPASKNDLETKNYSGVYVYVAIAGQIRTIEVSGLVLGGV